MTAGEAFTGRKVMADAVPRPPNPTWGQLYRVGGWSALLYVVIALALGSSPQSLHGGLVVLSNSYQNAGDAERASLTGAAEALIAATNAVSWAGILTAAAILLLSSIMRRASFFGSVLGIVGMVAGVLGVVSEAVRPMLGPGYSLYGLLLPTWFALVGWKLLHLDRGPTRAIGRGDDET